MPNYPPEPWRMAGDAYLSVWWLPTAEAPDVPSGLHPVELAGHTLLLTAWVDYRAPSPLTYHELLAAVPVRGGGQTGATITDIWVDDADSRAGGRQLWGIPKDMATFDVTTATTMRASAATESDWIATAAFTPRRNLPVALPGRSTIAQTLDATITHSPVRVRGYSSPAAASWNINPAGGLGYLAGRAPLLSMRLREFDMTFGRA